MATFTTRTTVSTRHEWIVPAAEPWGAFLGDIEAAAAAASRAYRQQHGMAEAETLSDDALRWRPTDDAIVISFTTEEPQR
ncbi:hypothetical protein [Streptomyces sp. NPDC054784]